MVKDLKPFCKTVLGLAKPIQLCRTVLHSFTTFTTIKTIGLLVEEERLESGIPACPPFPLVLAVHLHVVGGKALWGPGNDFAFAAVEINRNDVAFLCSGRRQQRLPFLAVAIGN